MCVQVKAVGNQQPLPEKTVDIGVKTDGCTAYVKGFGELVPMNRIAQGELDPGVAIHHRHLALTSQSAHFVSEFALMKQNFIDTPGFWINGNLAKQMNQQLARAAERINFVLVFTGGAGGTGRGRHDQHGDPCLVRAVGDAG